MMKIVPLITCEITFGQHVCDLMFGVNVTDLNLGVKINLVKQPIQSNSVGPLSSKTYNIVLEPKIRCI